MKKPTKNEVYLLIGFIGIFVAALVYFFVFKKNMDKVKQLEAESATLTERVSVLEGYEANYDQWQSEIYTMSDDIDAVFAKFPADVRPEDAVYDAISIQNYSQVDMDSITYGDAVQLYSPKAGSSAQIIEEAENKEREHYDIDAWSNKVDWIAAIQDGEFIDELVYWWENRNEDIANETAEDWSEAEAVDEAVEGEAAEGQVPEEGQVSETGEPVIEYDEQGNPISTSGIFLMNQPVSYLALYKTDEMKSAFAYIIDNYNRSVIDNVAIAFDSSKGELNVNVDVNKYYITGTEKTYEAPDFSGVSLGTDNLFSTLEAPKHEEE